MSDHQRLLKEWTEICQQAINSCPIIFLPEFTRVMLAGQRMITEATLCQQINGAQREGQGRLVIKGGRTS